MAREGEDVGTAPTIHSMDRDPGTSHVRVSHEPTAPGGPAHETYALEGEIGRGGMGIVVRARDRRLGRVVALKALHPPLVTAPMVRRRFLTEAQVGAQLEHPNIVPVYAMEESDQGPAFSMRLLGGHPLAAYLAECATQVRAGAVDEDHALPERLECFLKICDAVAYAHSRGVIHRDIKPANVIVGEHHEVYLVDWGIAKVLSEPDDEAGPPTRSAAEVAAVSVSSEDDLDTATQHGELVGTPTYMPPEQAMGQLERQGPASDQFALGMLLQELVTLAPPRAGPTYEQIVLACEGKRAPFVPIGGRAPPPALVAIVEKATAEAIDARYPSVEALADDVRRFVRGDEVSVLPDGPALRVWKRLSRRPGLVLGAIGAALVVASLGTALSAWQSAEATRRASHQSARVGRLTGRVVSRSEAIDERFARARTLVEGLGVAIEERLAADEPVDGPLRYGVAGRLVGERGPPLASLHEVARYGFRVSWETPLYLYPPEVSFEEVERTIRVMAPLEARFRGVLLRSLDDQATTWSRERQDRVLDAGTTPLHVTYVGFENGLLLNYPGYEPFPADYDPRRRPWYREARARHGVTFGRPYPDASGSAILVPCNRPVRDARGRLVAVAGADMALDDLARAMRIDHAGWIRSSLVHADGAQIVDTEQAGLRLGVGLHDDAPVAARPIEPEVLAAIERHGTGFVRRGDELVFFDRLEAIDWTFVVRMAAAEVL